MSKKILFLFDVDGTLTNSREIIKDEMKDFLYKLKNNINFHIGFVGGSNLEKQREQLTEEVFNLFHYKFPENGMVAYENNDMINNVSFFDFIDEESYKRFINFCLKYISEIDLPKKRGTFIELRRGMVNISPIGRNCTKEEREEFYEFDKKNKIRENMVKVLKKEFSAVPLDYAIGGQISIDVFPKGMNKTYCLKLIKKERYEKIYFFGDRTFEGGNDYELFNHPDVIGYSVKNPEDTIKFLNEIIKKLK